MRRIRNQTGERIQRFVFTLNNYTKEEEEDIQKWTPMWLIYGRENATTGTPHLQGACVIGKKMSFNTVKKLPGFQRAHIEIMKGTVQHNIAYCSKEDPNPYVYGSPPQPGKRNDLKKCVELMEQGQTVRDICQSNNIDAKASIAMYTRGLLFLQSQQIQPERIPPKVIWISGPTGIGKTRAATEFANTVAQDYWVSGGDLRWFDGYNDHRVAIIDDYRTGFCKFAHLLRLLDRYRMSVEIKCSTANWIPEYIIITAPKPAREMWNLRTEEDLEQLERRITTQIQEKNYEDIKKALEKLMPGAQEEEQEKEKDKEPEAELSWGEISEEEIEKDRASNN